MPRACDACAGFLSGAEPQPLDEFLETIASPVLVINRDGLVEAANGKARVFLGKTAAEMDGRRAGDVIECVYSHLPEGCGHTVHCKGCALRRSVEYTNSTGEALFGVLTYQDIQTSSGIQKTWFVIATERVRDLVVVRIDDVGAEHRT